MKISTEERFNRGFLLVPNQCWRWIKSKYPQGYGKFRYNGKTIKSHRMSWEIFKGPIPEGLQVLHKCDNPPCVNPEHLFLGTNKDNVNDKVSKGRQARHTLSRGENQGLAKLTESDVLRIRDSYKIGNFSQSQLAKEFSVSQSLISAIITNIVWKHI